MAKKLNNNFKTFSPKQELLDLMPDISGNDINGLGEATARNPSPVMWHDPSIIPHGDVQKWFSQQGNSHRDIKTFKSGEGIEQSELPEISDNRPNRSVEEWTSHVKHMALESGADSVGIAELDQEWVFEGYEADYKYMIVLVVAMDYDNLSQAPGEIAQNEVKAQYNRGTRTAYKLASALRKEGWDASPHGGPQAGPALMIPAAISAGLGQLGKHGSMINQTYGSSFRLANVLTNLPLIVDSPEEFGSEDFCLNCQLCTNVCPVDAISPDKQLVRGVEKWYVDFDKCLPFFVENNSCAMCLPICPYSRPGVAPRLIDKFTKRVSG